MTVLAGASMTAGLSGGGAACEPDSPRPLRIGIDIRPAQGTSKTRGIGRYILDVIEGLAAVAPCNEYLLLALPEAETPERFLNLPSCCRVVPLPTAHLGHLKGLHQRIRWQKLPPVWAWYCRRNQAVNARALAALARRERLDILHLTSLFESTFFTDADYPCPTVKTFYDATPLAMADAFLRRWPYQLRAVYRRQAAAIPAGSAEAIVAISESAKQDAVGLMAVPEERIRVIYPAIPDGYDVAASAAEIYRCRGMLGLEDRPFFLFCSGGGPNKNRDGAVRAFARFAARHPQGRKYAFVVAGPAGGDEATLTEIALQDGLQPSQLILTGYISDTDLVALFSSAVALFSPSFYEGFGLPAAQALQIGLPVIAADTSSLPEVIGGTGLKVDPTDIDDMASALARLADDPELRLSLSARGKLQAARFTARRQAAAHLRLYRSLAEAAVGSRAGQGSVA